MKIVLGVDDSPHSDAAVEFVKRMTWPTDTSVIVVSAVRPFVASYVEAYVPAPGYSQDMTAELTRFHEETAASTERALRKCGLKTEARVPDGDPRTVLIEVAQKEHADLVVVGSHGRTGMAKLLMGSVAAHVVSHAPCSVMVVKLAKQAA